MTISELLYRIRKNDDNLLDNYMQIQFVKSMTADMEAPITQESIRRHQKTAALLNAKNRNQPFHQKVVFRITSQKNKLYHAILNRARRNWPKEFQDLPLNVQIKVSCDNRSL